MAITHSITKNYIRFFVNPGFRDRPIDYRENLKKCRDVLICYPIFDDAIRYSAELSEINSIFSNKNLSIIHFGYDRYTPEKHKLQSLFDHPIKFLDVTRQNLWNIVRSKSIRELSAHSFDLFIDLDIRFNLINIYLCRLLRPAVRVCFSKPYCNHFYNVQYRTSINSPYKEKLKSLTNFFNTLLT